MKLLKCSGSCYVSFLLELLPNAPENVEVDALTEKSLMVSWSTPSENWDDIRAYWVNVTALKSFDDRLIDPNEGDGSSPTATSTATETKRVVVPHNQNHTILSDLKPFTMYEISVIAVNEHGSSLPSYYVRSLTLTPGKLKQTTVADVPELPDIRSCCLNRGVKHETCINKLCNPSVADTTEITDLMICAPWAAKTYGCLTNGLDHTPCCKARGLPDVCQQLCAGNVTTFDFNHFK